MRLLHGRPSIVRDVAALLLLVGGLLLVVPGGWLFWLCLDYTIPLDCTDQPPFECGLGQLFFGIACVMIVVGAAHFIAMVGIVRRGRWAAWLAAANMDAALTG